MRCMLCEHVVTTVGQFATSNHDLHRSMLLLSHCHLAYTHHCAGIMHQFRLCLSRRPSTEGVRSAACKQIMCWMRPSKYGETIPENRLSGEWKNRRVLNSIHCFSPDWHQQFCAIPLTQLILEDEQQAECKHREHKQMWVQVHPNHTLSSSKHAALKELCAKAYVSILNLTHTYCCCKALRHWAQR